MPNTDPVNDSPSVTEYMLKRASEAGLVHLHPIGAISNPGSNEWEPVLGDMHTYPRVPHRELHQGNRPLPRAVHYRLHCDTACRQEDQPTAQLLR
jgi:hypothetical protein